VSRRVCCVGLFGVFLLFVRWFIRLFVCSFVRLFVCSFVRLFVCSFVRLFVGLLPGCILRLAPTCVATSTAPHVHPSSLFVMFPMLAGTPLLLYNATDRRVFGLFVAREPVAVTAPGPFLHASPTPLTVHCKVMLVMQCPPITEDMHHQFFIVRRLRACLSFSVSVCLRAAA
jgi:hypothetical protein